MAINGTGPKGRGTGVAKAVIAVLAVTFLMAASASVLSFENDNDNDDPLDVLGAAGDVLMVAAGDHHSLALMKDGTVWSWGRGSSGQLGIGAYTSSTQSNMPVQVLKGDSPSSSAYLENVTYIAAGYYQSFAIKSDGTVWAWGNNFYGQLGIGTTGTGTNKGAPAQMMVGTTPLTGVTELVSSEHGMALKSDGTVWTWGYNSSGQLGNGLSGAVTSSGTPAQVPGLTGVTAISATVESSAAVKSDGTVWTWGKNTRGQLGDGNITDSNVPVQVHGVNNVGVLTGVTAIAIGDDHMLALKSDGTVWTWGSNAYGQLGNWTSTNSRTPVQVHGANNVGFLTGVTAVAADARYCAVLKSDGTVWTWGQNNNGQLGNESYTDSDTPVQVKGLNGVGNLTGVTAISSGLTHTLVIKNDGTVWTWGDNINGELGIGTSGSTEGKNTPVKVLLRYPLAGTATIGNTTPRIGDTLTASLDAGNNTGTLSYQWKANGTNAGTGSSYTVAVADLGKVITVEITSSVETGTVTSAATSAVQKKAAPAAPAAPVMSAKTYYSITLSAVPGYEYSVDGITWQPSNVFGGLNANTAYTFYQRVAETFDTYASASSPGQSITTDPAPLAGTAAIDNTAPKIGDTLTASLIGGNNTGVLSYQWKVDGTDAETGSSYTVAAADLGKVITVEITSSVETGTITSAATAAVVKKDAPAAPAAPALYAKTYYSITLSAVPGYEYSVDGITWQPSNVFDGLDANTAYTFYQRVAETLDTYASASSPGQSITTDPAPLAGTAAIDNTTPKIGDILTASLIGGNNTGVLSYQWKVDGTDAGTGPSYTVAVADLGKTITAEIASSVETGIVTSAATAAVVKKDAPAAPAAPVSLLKSYNSVTLASTAGYEYSNDGTAWQPGNVFGGLSAGTESTFYQRIAETDDTYASASSPALIVKTDCTVTVSGGSASVTSGPDGTLVTLTPGPAPDGMRFKGWNVISGGVMVSENTFLITGSNVEIEAIWEEIPDTHALAILVAAFVVLLLIIAGGIIVAKKP